MLIPSSSVSKLPGLFQLIDSLPSSLNPYSAILNSLNAAKADLDKTLKSYTHFLLVLLIVHSVLGVIALISLCVKIFKKNENGERRKLWLWRKHYSSPGRRPHYVPNGHLIIECMQLLGCSLLWLFSLITLRFCQSPEASSTSVYSIMAFLMSTAFAPGFFGFWLNGWGAFYVAFNSPNARSNNTWGRHIFDTHPSIINTLCIGASALIVIFYGGIGIRQAVAHHQLFNNFAILNKTLADLSASWRPDNPMNNDNNQVVFGILQTLATEGTSVLFWFKLVALTWTAWSVVIILFYAVSTIGISKMFSSTIDTARSPPIVLNIRVTEKHYQSPVTDSAGEIGSEEASQVSEAAKNPTLSTRLAPSNLKSLRLLKTNYFLLCTNWLTVTIAMGFIGSLGILFYLKVATLLSRDRPLPLVIMLTASAISLSLGIFLSTLLTAIPL